MVTQQHRRSLAYARPGAGARHTHRGSRRAAIAAGAAASALAATLALSGCGVQTAGAAAVVNGRVISDNDAQTAAVQTNAGVPNLSQPFTPANAVVVLILAPYVLDAAAAGGHAVSAAQAKQTLSKLADPAPATIELVRTQLAISQLTEADKTRILDQVKKADIRVSPRYGSFDPAQVGFVPRQPNWMVPTPVATHMATPTPSTSPGG